MADVNRRTEDWATLSWKQYQRNVYRLQKRIYRAKRRGDVKRVHNLQRLLLRSWSARTLAVRRVTQDNRGKRTPGVDGVASLTPKQRLAYAKRLRHLDQAADPVRRTYLPKPNGELRPLGIPTMYDRAKQALVKLALEPEWEAIFEPNSYGYRPGRSAHDAIAAIFLSLHLKPKYVLEADIEKCFERINHQVLLEKLSAIQPITRLIRAWLKAGVMDQGRLLFPEAGTPQGGVISPLLANVALHGLEEELVNSCPKREKPAVIRFADDLVTLHSDLDTLLQLAERAERWLAPRGLRFKPEKTRITHTLQQYEGRVGFDFLGFNVRQYRVGKYRTSTHRGQPGFKTLIKPSKQAIKRHVAQLRPVIRRYRGSLQAFLIAALNRIIRGWTRYYRTCVAKQVFSGISRTVYEMLVRWAVFRHPQKGKSWCFRRYWRRLNGIIVFSDGTYTLYEHERTKIVRHVKVRGTKSPFDGDWTYWAARLGRDPTRPRRVVNLLKQQNGNCGVCGLRFTTEDVVEIHHLDGDRRNNRYVNLTLLHGHCHDYVHGARCL